MEDLAGEPNHAVATVATQEGVGLISAFQWCPGRIRENKKDSLRNSGETRMHSSIRTETARTPIFTAVGVYPLVFLEFPFSLTI